MLQIMKTQTVQTVWVWQYAPSQKAQPRAGRWRLRWKTEIYERAQQKSPQWRSDPRDGFEQEYSCGDPGHSHGLG